MRRIIDQFQRMEGQSTVLLAVAMTAIMGLGAIVADVSLLVVNRQRLQNAVDVALLASGQDMPDTSRAAATATSYFKKNADNATVNVTFPDSQTISLTASTTVKLTFAKVLGYTSTTVATSGAAKTGQMGQALDYTLFSGSQTSALLTNGQNIYVGGNSHTNKNFVANGQKITITGACEAVSTITSTGAQIDIPHRVPNSPYVPMPDFSELLKAKAQQAGTYYVGNKTYNGSNITVNSSIYVEGNLVINGAHFTGNGTIVATGSITFNGSGQKVNAADAVAFYSKNAGITINGSRLTVDGILYAPNGNIYLNGNNQTVHGRVVGNTVTMNGSDFTMTSSTDDLKALPSTGVKLIR